MAQNCTGPTPALAHSKLTRSCLTRTRSGSTTWGAAASSTSNTITTSNSTIRWAVRPRCAHSVCFSAPWPLIPPSASRFGRAALLCTRCCFVGLAHHTFPSILLWPMLKAGHGASLNGRHWVLLVVAGLPALPPLPRVPRVRRRHVRASRPASMDIPTARLQLGMSYQMPKCVQDQWLTTRTHALPHSLCPCVPLPPLHRLQTASGLRVSTLRLRSSTELKV